LARDLILALEAQLFEIGRQNCTLWQLQILFLAPTFLKFYPCRMAKTFTLAICFVPNYFDNKNGGAICRNQKYLG